MPSFTKIALSLLALSASVFAGTLEEGDIFVNGLEKRAIGSESLDFSAVSSLAKRASDNIGVKCKRDKKCHSSQPLAKPFCNKKGRCDFTCKGASRRQGNKCVGSSKPKKCLFNASCPKVKIANAHAVCALGKCAFQCNGGFHSVGNRCRANPKLCGGRPPFNVKNGFSLCQNNKWVPQCHFYLGFQLYQKNGQYSCIRPDSDPANCGKIGNQCPGGYNGIGNPRCYGGKCALDCFGYKTRTLPNGQSYCSRV